MNVLVFDIETVPDVVGGRQLHDLEGLSDKEVGEVMAHLRRQETGDSEFLRLHMHRVVAISTLLRVGETLRVWSLGDVDADEGELIQRFFDGIDKFSPTLVSWNGTGFDLPVLHYRALFQGVTAPRYWDTGEEDREFRWNNYLNRFHSRHTDLMEVLSGYQARAAAPLDQIASLLGFPGKMGMSGSQVWERCLGGDLEGVRHYCETDVLNTYLVYVRFEQMRGRVTPEAAEAELDKVRDYLREDGQPHLLAFLEAWETGSG